MASSTRTSFNLVLLGDRSSSLHLVRTPQETLAGTSSLSIVYSVAKIHQHFEQPTRRSPSERTNEANERSIFPPSPLSAPPLLQPLLPHRNPTRSHPHLRHPHRSSRRTVRLGRRKLVPYPHPQLNLLLLLFVPLQQQQPFLLPRRRPRTQPRTRGEGQETASDDQEGV